jgi:hypothetical protein
MVLLFCLTGTFEMLLIPIFRKYSKAVELVKLSSLCHLYRLKPNAFLLSRRRFLIFIIFLHLF